MATALTLQPEDEAPVAVEGLMLQDILAPGVNLANMLSDNDCMTIGQKVIRDMEIDEASRGEWLERYEKALNVAMQVKKPKVFPWVNAANVKYPLLTVASIQFQARAYPVIVDGSNLVKGRVLGPDPDGTKRARADRIGQHMTWQLLYKMPDWEEETDKLLLMLPIIGCVFRKTYYDSIANANRSEIVSGEDFIINAKAKSINDAPRYTQVLRYYPHEVAEFVAAGLWLEVPVDSRDGDSDEDALVDFYEQHRFLDLDKDGFAEPYVVTTTKEGEVARIVPCFGPEGIRVRDNRDGSVALLTDFLENDEDLSFVGAIVRIERRQYFTKYGFIPAPDGSFYDIGFGTLLEDITETIDTLLNQMLDAATLANAQGGFLGSGVNVRGGNFSFRTVGEWKRVDVIGGTLRENILPLSVPGPSAVSFNLLELLIQAAKDITAVQDVLTGQGTANQPATTTLALIEQGQKVMTGIFKRIHRSFGQELRILRRLNRDFLDDEEYFQLNDPEPQVGGDGQPLVGPDGKPQMNQTAKIGREDYADQDLDVIPVSDPSQVSDMQKMARSEAEWASFLNDPLINQVELRRRRMEALGVRDTKVMLEVPPPAPDPKLLIDGMKEAREKTVDAAKVRQLDASAAASLMGAAKIATELGLITDAAELAESATELGGMHDHTGAPDGPGPVQPMAPEPGDTGVPPIPPGPPDGIDGGMGPGLAGGAPPGSPDGGGMPGPIGQPDL